MATPVPPLSQLLRQLTPDGDAVPDGELLRRYADHRDEAAFELLLWRHAGMVWGVCRRVAPDQAAAEDAFQATALALARHAGTIRSAGSLAGWLYRVAYRAALSVRPHREVTVARVPDRPAPGPGPAEAAEAGDLSRVIDAELSSLPDTFRLPLVLCELEGHSNAEAAAILGCPIGTVESRLTRARSRLRDRLSRRGVTLALGVLATSQVPGPVHAGGVRAACNPASAPAAVRELAAHAVRAAGSQHLRAAALLFTGLTALAVGLAVAVGPKPAAPPPPSPDAGDGEQPRPAPREVRLGSARFRHSGPVFHAAFAPDGKSLATAALGSVSVWETATGRLLRRIERAGTLFHRVAFAAQGKTLYAVVGPTEEGCELLTLDPATGKERGRVMIPKVHYAGAEFSPDAGRLAVFSRQEPEAVLIDPATGKELARVSAPGQGNGFTPDGKRLVLAGGNEEVRLVDATTGAAAGKLTPGDRRPEWVRFAPSGAVLLASHNWVERWDPKRNVSVWKTDFLPSGSGLEVSPDGERVAHVSSFGVTVIDVGSGKRLFRAQGDSDTSARFSPDGRTLALTTWSGVVTLWDAATGKSLAQSPELSGTVGGLTFSHDGRRLMAAAGERWVSWDLAGTRPDSRPVPLADFAVLAPDGRVSVRPDSSQKADDPAEFVDPVSGKRISRFDPAETGDTVVMSQGLFSGDGRRFVGLQRGKRGPGGQQTDLGLAVWDVATGKRIAQRPEGKDTAVAVAVSPDGQAVAVLVPRTTRMSVWEPDTGRTRWARDLGLSMPFATFTRGGDRLVLQEVALSIPQDGFNLPRSPGPHPLFVLDAATGKERRMLIGPPVGPQPLVFADGSTYPVPSARAVSPDGRSAAISGFDGTIYLWDLATDRQRGKLWHPGPVHDLAFSPDGKTLAAASLAAPIMIYDLTTLGGTKPGSDRGQP